MLQYLYVNNRKFRRAAGGFLGLMLFVLLTDAARAQQTVGFLDATFDGDGKILTGFGNPDTIASSVVVQRDGKVVVVGLAGAIDLQSEAPGSSDFLVLRYNADGTPDTTFDGDGRVVTGFGDGEDGASTVLIQPDGRILVAGAINMKTPQGQIALARYNADGSLDTTFDEDGMLTTDVAELQNVEERAESMILQPDGKILVVVSTVKENFLEDQVFVVRYNADGTRDNSFAGDGITTLPWVIPGGVAQGLTGNDLALQPDGKVVVAGSVATAEFSDVFVWRLNADGTNDETFGGRAVRVSFNASDLAISVFVRPGNKIFVAGSSFSDTTFRNDYTFARFNADGSPDTTFDGDGKKTTVDAAAITFPLDYEIQADGKIVSAGLIVDGATAFKTNFVVTRFDANGNLDATFGNGGKAVTAFGDGLDSAQALVIQTDGKIIAAGASETEAASDDYKLAVARYVGDGGAVAPVKAPFDFDGDGKSDVSGFRPSDGTWYIQPSGANDPNALYGKQWGLGSDRLAPADYDGDGKTDTAVWRAAEGNFYILNSTDNSVRVENFGLAGDELTVGDWDGDGKADPAVYRDGAQSYFFYRGSLNNPTGNITYLPWGTAGDRPQRGDFDGDGRLDAAVFRPSNGVWYIRRSSDSEVRYQNWGLASDKFVPADYDGDGKTDLAVFRDGTWYILQSSNNQPRYVYWGLNADRLVPADYDGDGKIDAAVFRAGVWYVMESSSGSARIRYFGLAGDMPVANAYLN